MALLESSIPDHLQKERTIPSKLPKEYDPPFPGYSARFPRDAKTLVMVVLGSQHSSSKKHATAALEKLLSFIKGSSMDYEPFYWEPASYTDNTGAYNQAVIAYWQTEQKYQGWANSSSFDSWWHDLDPETEPHGWFLEVFLPSLDRFETIFSDDSHPEGAAHMAPTMSGPIREHVYWGSMRDRLPASQTDALAGVKATNTAQDKSLAERKHRIRVLPRENLAIIRSGQDWSNTTPHERKLYLETMHPVLIKGMDFLRDHGEEVGCYSCRFMEVLDNSSLRRGTERTFGLAFFDDLSSLEDWSKRHKTHLDIFGRFLQYAKELQNQVSLRLYHEVLVLKSDQQIFEYVGCHGKTGMLPSR